MGDPNQSWAHATTVATVCHSFNAQQMSPVALPINIVSIWFQGACTVYCIFIVFYRVVALLFAAMLKNCRKPSSDQNIVLWINKRSLTRCWSFIYMKWSQDTMTSDPLHQLSSLCPAVSPVSLAFSAACRNRLTLPMSEYCPTSFPTIAPKGPYKSASPSPNKECSVPISSWRAVVPRIHILPLDKQVLLWESQF